MAIGTSITPRGYNVDPTGKAYTLDPDPLLDVQAKTFASQRETMRMVADTAKQGISFAEYLGARQQLGRVKAQLGDLDPNSPDFTSRYSQIVMENPLAFTNEKVAPVTRMAITPLLSTAMKAQEDRAALSRAQVMAGINTARTSQSSADLLQRQKAYYDYQRQNPKGSSSRPSAWERFIPSAGTLNPDTEADLLNPPAPTDATPPPGSSSAPGSLLPEGMPIEGGTGSGPSPLPDIEPPFEPDDTGEYSDVIEGQGDGNGVFKPPGSGNGIFKSPIPGMGDMQVDSVGKEVTLKPVRRVPEPDPIPGRVWVPDEINIDKSVAKWKSVPKAGLSEVDAKQMELMVNSKVNTDPDVLAAKAVAVAQKAHAEALKSQLGVIDKTDSAAITAHMEKLTEAEQTADQTQLIVDQKIAAASNKVRAIIDPVYAARVQAVEHVEQVKKAVDDETLSNLLDEGWSPVQDAMPAKTEEAAPAARMSAAEQLASQKVVPPAEAARNQQWTDEKVFALTEAKKLSTALGITDDALLAAVQSKDNKSLSAIMDQAEARGITSPLIMEPVKPGTISGEWEGGPVMKMWARSKVGKDYLDVLRAAVGDPNAVRQANVSLSASGKTTKGRTWEAVTPFKKTP